MSSFKELLLNEINLCRTNPKSYANNLLLLQKYFKGNVFSYPNHTPILTSEGFHAFEEAAETLKNLKPLSELSEIPELCLISADALKQQDFYGSNIDIDSIILTYGNVVGPFSELIDYGSGFPELVVYNLLADDGDLSRSNREALLDSKFRLIGISTNKHRIYNTVTTISLARHFFVKDQDKEEDFAYLSDENFEPEVRSNKDKRKEIKGRAVKPKDPVVFISNLNDDAIDTDNVVKIDKLEKEITEQGVRKRITKLIKHLVDGTIQTEIYKENV